MNIIYLRQDERELRAAKDEHSGPLLDQMGCSRNQLISTLATGMPGLYPRLSIDGAHDQGLLGLIRNQQRQSNTLSGMVIDATLNSPRGGEQPDLSFRTVGSLNKVDGFGQHVDDGNPQMTLDTLNIGVGRIAGDRNGIRPFAL
ncbi:hypothetical protein D9M69_638470 [compost metagenome]